MKENGIDAFAQQWTNDGAFRSAFRTDAASALSAHGIELSREEWAAVQAIAGASSSLEARLNLESNPAGTGSTYC